MSGEESRQAGGHAAAAKPGCYELVRAVCVPRLRRRSPVRLLRLLMMVATNALYCCRTFESDRKSSFGLPGPSTVSTHHCAVP